MSRSHDRGRRRARPLSRAREAAVALALTVLSTSCAEGVRPVLGGLKIGSAAHSFHMPVLEDQKLPIEYPRDAWAAGVGGEVLLRIRITEEGAVDSVLVMRSAGHPSLDSAAVAGALRLRYRPARQGKEAVAVWGTLPVRFPMPEGVPSP